LNEFSNELLEVHVFPHSHMDLEWLHDMKTNYYFKAKKVYLSVIESIKK